MTAMNTPFHLTGKTILITGASSGIGRNAAKRICEMGAKVILTGRDADRLSAAAVECGVGNTTIIVADLCTEEGRNHLAKQTPQLDGFVNCMGTVQPFPVRFLTQEKLEQTMGTNFDAPVLTTASLLKEKKLNRESSLIYLSSISSARPQAGASLYGGSKAAIESFVKVLAQELSAQQMRVNSIAPAMVKTPMFDKAEEMISKEDMDNHIAKYRLGVGYPDDVANSIIFLLSPGSRWITGINLILDGGLLL